MTENITWICSISLFVGYKLYATGLKPPVGVKIVYIFPVKVF